MPTLQDMLKKVRELSFDRFVTPTFFLRKTKYFEVSFNIAIDSVTLSRKEVSGASEVINETFAIEATTTLEEVLTWLASKDYVGVVYSGSFIPSELASSLIVKNYGELSKYHPVFRKNYFGDARLTEMFKDYVRKVMGKDNPTVDNLTNEQWDTEFGDSSFDPYRQKHFSLWCAFHIVGDRRIYELASQQLIGTEVGGTINQSNAVELSDGLDGSNFSLFSPGSDVTVQVGDTFTLTQDKNSAMGLYNNGEVPNEMLAPWSVGSDNQLMDYFSFWYRLQLWLRDKLEQETGDYSLRKNTVVSGRLSLDPRGSYKFYSYFDSFPWVFSPYLRGIPNVDTQNLRT